MIDLKTKITSLSWGRTGLVNRFLNAKLALCDGGKVTVYGPTETQWEEYFSFVVPYQVNSLNWVCNDDYLVSLALPQIVAGTEIGIYDYSKDFLKPEFR